MNHTCPVAGCGTPTRLGNKCKRCYRRDYYARNKSKEKQQSAAWRAANQDRNRERLADWYRANADRVKADHAAKYHADPEKGRQVAAEWRRRNPGRSDAWRKQNPERWALLNRENQRRRHRSKPVNFAAILDEYGMVCHICSGDIADLSDLHFDHVIPLIRGGAHAAENIRPSHATCNLRKGSRLLT